MHYSMVKLPENPMMPRLYDERVGYFTTDQMDYGPDEHRAPRRRYISRWRLEKKDPSAELSEPAAYRLSEFLEDVRHGIWGELDAPLAETGERASRLQDRGPARLIECADPVLASLIANDPRTRHLCFLAGERYIVVLTRNESQFRRALKALGYVYQIKSQ